MTGDVMDAVERGYSSNETRAKTFKFSVCLKGVGHASRKKLRAIGLDKNLAIATQEVTFTDARNLGWKHAAFAMAIAERERDLINRVVKCVVEEVKE